MNCTIFGAGKIARGFIGHLLYLSDIEFTFVEKFEGLVVKAWPAEEVATERYNRLLWQLKAYVALEAPPGISATAAAACRFPNI